MLGAAFPVSPEQEVELGLQFKKQMDPKFNFVKDEAVLGYVKKVGGIVVANSPAQSQVPVKFHVIADKEINAFAIPGGDIYVHTGLLSAAADEAELASVMAHELGHVVYRHSAQHISQQKGLGVIQQIVLGAEGAQGAALVTDILGSGLLSKFSRDDESEADYLAVPTLARAKYDPTAMVTFFETLRERYGDQNPLLTFTASHPATADRITRVRAEIAKTGVTDGLRPVNDLRKAQGRLQQLGLLAAAPPAPQGGARTRLMAAAARAQGANLDFISARR